MQFTIPADAQVAFILSASNQEAAYAAGPLRFTVWRRTEHERLHGVATYGAEIGEAKRRRATATAIAMLPTPVATSTCDTMPAGVTILSYEGGTQCRVVGGAAIADPSIAANYTTAVDIYGWLGDGIEVCLAGAGSIAFLDAAYSPRALSYPAYYYANGQTCTALSVPGTVVLQPGPAGPPPEAAGETACTLTTTGNLNFRTAPMGKIMYSLRKGTSVIATGKVGAWYMVSHHGLDGYVHGGWVTASGNC